MNIDRKNVRAGLMVAFGAVLAVASLSDPTMARAETSPTTETVKLEVKATIPARCGFTDVPIVPTGKRDVTRQTTIDMPFKVDCNQPFTIRMSSGNGALKYVGTGDRFGFLDVKPYEVSLELGLSNAEKITRSCSSATLNPASAASAGEGMGVGCDFYGTARRSGLSSQAAIAASDAAPSLLRVSWTDASSTRRLLAGAYQDTLTIVVEPRS